MTQDKMRLLAQKFSEAWTACMLCMVQGDLTVISINHAITASKTGIIAGISVVLVSYYNKLNTRYGLVWMTALLTACADFVVHPTHFGPEWMEAIVTGIGAGLLAWVLSRRDAKNK